MLAATAEILAFLANLARVHSFADLRNTSCLKIWTDAVAFPTEQRQLSSRILLRLVLETGADRDAPNLACHPGAARKWEKGTCE